MKRGVYMANETKPSLYEYYLKLVPDTVIFDEIERIAWQNNVICGSFNGNGVIIDGNVVIDDKIGLFFYIDDTYDGNDYINANACRLFLKIYDICDADIVGESYNIDTRNIITEDPLTYSNNLPTNIICMDKFLSEIELKTKDLIKKDYSYMIIDSEGIIKLPSSLYKNRVIVGVKF